jgi:peptide/nickel transport system permease protein
VTIAVDELAASIPSPGPKRAVWAGPLGRAMRSRQGAIGLAAAGVVVVVAVVGPFVAPHSSTDFITEPFAKPSSSALLGGDTLGRDVLSRVLDGGWVLLIMATLSTIVGVASGAAAGLASAHLRGRWDAGIMRTVDVLLAFPQLVFALLLVSIVGPKLWLIVVAVAMTHLPQVARVVRSAALDVSERDFVKVATVLGVPPWKVALTEVLPNVTSTLAVEAGLRLTYSIVTISALNFLNFGQAPPAPNWGVMISENRLGVQANVWSVAVPAILIALITIGSNLFTDAVARELLDSGHDST